MTNAPVHVVMYSITHAHPVFEEHVVMYSNATYDPRKETVRTTWSVKAASCAMLWHATQVTAADRSGAAEM